MEAWSSSPLKFLEKSKHDCGEDSWKTETTFKTQKEKKWKETIQDVYIY